MARIICEESKYLCTFIDSQGQVVLENPVRSQQFPQGSIYRQNKAWIIDKLSLFNVFQSQWKMSRAWESYVTLPTIDWCSLIKSKYRRFTIHSPFFYSDLWCKTWKKKWKITDAISFVICHFWKRKSPNNECCEDKFMVDGNILILKNQAIKFC
jgi:ribosomal protein L11 methylase PrmA